MQGLTTEKLMAGVENARPDNRGTDGRGRKRETWQRKNQSQGWKMQNLTTWKQIRRMSKDIRLIIRLTQNSEEKDRYLYF